MQRYNFDNEEEFEPRVTPKPVTKLDCFAVPTVPEISLIFEKPVAQNLNDGRTNSSPARSLKPLQLSKNTANHTSVSPVLSNANSYAAWREQTYSRQTNPTTQISPLYKNTHNCNHALQSGLQDASMQKQQRQDQICDVEKRVRNVRATSGMHEKSVKFKCTNVNDSYNREAHLSPSNKGHLPCNSLQKAMYDVSDYTVRMPSEAISDAPKKTEHLQIPYTQYQQFHAPNYSNCNTDNNETVKTLLQLVSSQSEQIKTLQLQVDRLMRMQEENYRNRSACMCSQSVANQIFRYPTINCYDTALSSSIAQSQNQGAKKNADSQNAVVEKKESFGENNKLESALLEQQSKKKFMEQKVSIGVMTSFEFTVQNSPFLIDSNRNDMYEQKETHREGNNINRRNAINMHDATESVQRYKNTFARKPGTAQLENIVEDSESYLSSSQQQSSNFNASSSVRDSERHTPKQSDLYNAVNTSESSKRYLATDLNREKMHKGMYARENSNIDEQVQNIRRISNASMNVNHGSTGNYSKALVSDINDYTMIDTERSADKMNANKYPLHNIHLPATDYYPSSRNKEHGANTEQTKNVSDSMILSGGDLKVLERPPTPEPSIHVEMQEYTSDDESDKPKRTSKIGWTFYNDVLGQVNEILQNSSVLDDKDHNDAKMAHRVEQENDTETRTALNTVKAATLEQLRRLGISLTDNNEHREPNSNNKTVEFDSSFYPRLDRQANMMHTTATSVNETNTSMHMKALALKYLSDEQLADLALHKQESSLKHLMVSNMQGTNMSFATMRYLERYQLLPGKNNVQAEDINQIHNETAPKHDFKPATGKNNPAICRFPFAQTPGTTCPSRILDLSTLKRQPKLL